MIGNIEYFQRTGIITLNNRLLSVCYSGFGLGLNNPALEASADIGPIPAGTWTISDWFILPYEDKGPLVAHLTPSSGFTTRSGFLIHGDNKAQDHTASHGCIIASYSVRKQLFQSNVTTLEVKSGL